MTFNYYASMLYHHKNIACFFKMIVRFANKSYLRI